MNKQLATKGSTSQNQDFHRCPNCDEAYYANATAERLIECPYCGKLTLINKGIRDEQTM